MPVILFGSISTIADTSELQREAFNAAFERHGLGWHWERDEYRQLLEHSGGRDRIDAYAAERGQEVDAAAVHATKSEVFQHLLASSGIAPRPGVAEVIAGARRAGVPVALVTTTSPGNVSALVTTMSPDLGSDAFQIVIDAAQVDRPKPDAAAYLLALDRLGADARDCVAVEDNVDGVSSATAAGVRCVAFPNANTAGHDFSTAERQVERLDFEDLQATIRKAS